MSGAVVTLLVLGLLLSEFNRWLSKRLVAAQDGFISAQRDRIATADNYIEVLEESVRLRDDEIAALKDRVL